MALPITLQMSYLEALLDATRERHREIILARAYHEGYQPVYLTERQREYLELHSDNQFCLNLTRIVTTALADELNVVGFETDEATDENGVRKQAEWFWDVWNKNKMDAMQYDVHEKALSESEAFVILDWDAESGYPVMVLHERYTDIRVNAWEGTWSGLSSAIAEKLTGTGQGVWMIYENDDPYQKPVAAVQQWSETMEAENGNIDSRLRRTIYYPDRIERFAYGRNDEWEELENSPQRWTTKDGSPLGLPVIHFKNRGLRPEAWYVIPPQDAVNKTWVDILGAADLAGYPLYVLLGLYPTVDGKPPAPDGSNVWSVGPAQMLGNAGVKAGDASVTKYEGSDPTPLMSTLKDQIMFIAQLSGTPASRFITTAQIASDKTLKEQERELRKRALNRKILFGDAWEDVMIMARRIANAFGDAGLDENVTVETVWASIVTIDELKDQQSLGVPLESLWIALGKSPEQIAMMKDTGEYRIQREKAIWEGYAAASASGVPVEIYLRRIGLSDDEIREVVPEIGSERIPSTGM